MTRPVRTVRALCFTMLASSITLSSGCTMCCPPYMDDYATVGGKWARSNPTDGRVGSVFSDPGIVASASGEAVISDGVVEQYVPDQDQVRPQLRSGEEIEAIETPQAMETIILGDD